jgi:hypothetical protein
MIPECYWRPSARCMTSRCGEFKTAVVFQRGGEMERRYYFMNSRTE